MTPQEKAQELVDRFDEYVHGYVGGSVLSNTQYPDVKLERAKECALIAVDEVIANIEPSVSMDVITARIKYWEEVKNEIEKL